MCLTEMESSTVGGGSSKLGWKASQHPGPEQLQPQASHLPRDYRSAVHYLISGVGLNQKTLHVRPYGGSSKTPCTCT